MPTVYLIGVNHAYQLGPYSASPMFADKPLAPFEEFEAFLRSALGTHGVRGIAEEMSRAALRKHFRSGESVPCRLAEAVDLPHRYCDTDPETRKTLNMSDSDREKYWVKELITFNTFPVLFVLGADHIDSFARLLSKSGFEPVIIVRDWKASSDRDEAT